MLDFWEKRFDVLVCTTIVESGLDISNANTLIIERADTLGLSQLHQLRGRVGRGRERAYAYFLYPPEKPLTETAHDRLPTIASHSDLGAGMQIAMKDLEIRGAGNLLGGEQSGHIAGVGFDLYVRLVGEAVAEFRGDADDAPDRGQDRAAGRRPPAARLHAAASGCGWRCTRSWPRSRPTRPARRDRGRAASTATARRPSRCATCSRWPACASVARAAGIGDVSLQGNYVRFGPVDAAREPAAAPAAALPGLDRQGRSRARCSSRSR